MTEAPAEEDPYEVMDYVDARAVEALTDIRQTHLTDLNRE
jgi:hypothetical protein